VGGLQAQASVRDRLSGRHVLLTGATGFVGEALLHLLLTEVPDARLSVLVRPRGSTPAADRVSALLGKPIFADAVASAGGVEELLADRVAVVSGDVSDPPPLPADLDAVVHCAGDVSFDPPVDEAFRTNVVGARALLDRIDEAAADGRDIHYVHVSTAYVAGRRRGPVAEERLDHTVDVDAELAWGLSRTADVEARSRDADVLEGLRRDAEREHGRAGLVTAAAAAEDARKEWVRDELVRLGTERARSLGWTDCYTFTKALAERVVEEYATGRSRGSGPDGPRTSTSAAGRRVTIFRPSIIESALERPHPGWIEGFKMAEPLILAYGRGELPVFPGSADTTIDIVPVDQVAAALVACLAAPPAPGAPAYFHLASGSRNPVTFGMVYEFVRDYFTAAPFAAGRRGAARLPEWTWPGGPAVSRLMSTGERAHRVADRLLRLAPNGPRTRDWAHRLDRQGRRLRSLRRYLDLYEEYAQADVCFDDTEMLALHRSLSPDDQRIFAFDTATIDWRHYLHDVHAPAVTEPVRQLDAMRSRRRPADRSRLTVLAPRPPSEETGTPPAAAFFDMDGTLLTSNVVETYLWLRLAELSPGRKVAETARVAAQAPQLLLAERRDRGGFLRSVYQEYAGARLSTLDRIVDEHVAPHILERLAPQAVRRIREHRAAGHLCVLITGAIRPLTRPLAPLFDHIEAADLAVDEHGRCTGHLAASPVVGEARGSFARDLCRRHGIDPATSYAYADSYSDLPLLAAVGRPVAVSPDLALDRHARRKHWHVVDWPSSATSRRALDPATRR
jgi:fatty acyl-CoA reductase